MFAVKPEEGDSVPRSPEVIAVLRNQKYRATFNAQLGLHTAVSVDRDWSSGLDIPWNTFRMDGSVTACLWVCSSCHCRRVGDLVLRGRHRWMSECHECRGDFVGNCVLDPMNHALVEKDSWRVDCGLVSRALVGKSCRMCLLHCPHCSHWRRVCRLGRSVAGYPLRKDAT